MLTRIHSGSDQFEIVLMIRIHNACRIVVIQKPPNKRSLRRASPLLNHGSENLRYQDGRYTPTLSVLVLSNGVFCMFMHCMRVVSRRFLKRPPGSHEG